MRIDDDGITFECNGRQMYAHGRTIGLSTDFQVSYGYDGGWSNDEFSKAEKLEFANYMIDLWMQYRTKARLQEANNG